MTGVGYDTRTILRAGLLVLAMLSGLAAGTGDGSADYARMVQTAQASRNGVVLLTACRSDGGATRCRYATAWSPAPGVFVTAAHALNGLSTVQLSSRSRGDAPAAVTAVDSIHDIAVLRSALVVPSLRRDHDADPGDRLVAVCSRRAVAYQGHPGQSGLYTGELDGPPIRAVEPNDEQLLLERVAGARSVLGCSGGPVLDADGNVVGISVAGDGGSDGMVPIDFALDLVDSRP